MRGSASGFTLLRGTSTFTLVTTRIFAYPSFYGLCRWAPDRYVSISACHPNYMALAFTMTELAPARRRYPSLGTPHIKPNQVVDLRCPKNTYYMCNHKRLDKTKGKLAFTVTFLTSGVCCDTLISYAKYAYNLCVDKC